MTELSKYNELKFQNESLLPPTDTPNPYLDNDLSKLMYYLNTINKLINANIYYKYIDYQNYKILTKSDKKMILN